MKKARFISLFLTLALTLGVFAFAAPAMAASADPIKVLVNGKEVDFPDTQPYLDKSSRTMVPVRFVSEALGGAVEWDGDTRTVTMTRGTIVAKLIIGKKEITVMGIKKTIDVAPVVQNSRTMVPLRFVSEAFGCAVTWDGKTRTVTIKDEGKNTYKMGSFTVEITSEDETEKGSSGGLVVFKESGLIVIEDVPRDDTKPGLSFDIKVDLPNTDIPKQFEEARSLLKQVVSAKLADEIIAYAMQKQDWETDLPFKEFKESNVRIWAAGDLGPINVSVYID